jgi:hypothetical protein
MIFIRPTRPSESLISFRRAESYSYHSYHYWGWVHLMPARWPLWPGQQRIFTDVWKVRPSTSQNHFPWQLTPGCVLFKMFLGSATFDQWTWSNLHCIMHHFDFMSNSSKEIYRVLRRIVAICATRTWLCSQATQLIGTEQHGQDQACSEVQHCLQMTLQMEVAAACSKKLHPTCYFFGTSRTLVNAIKPYHLFETGNWWNMQNQRVSDGIGISGHMHLYLYCNYVILIYLELYRSY